MQYNTQRPHMPMPEYGRCVHDMIQHAITIPDRACRQQCVETIVSVMANMQPEMKTQPDFLQRLWDHVAYIANYKLDVDFPFPVTRLGENLQKPEPLSYPMKNIRQRQYGHILEEMLGKLAEMPEGAERNELLKLIANQMKQSLFIWNRDAMDDRKVAADIEQYTNGAVTLDLNNFRFAAVQTLPRQGNEGRRKKRK